MTQGPSAAEALFWAQPMGSGEAERLVEAALHLADRGWNVRLAWGGPVLPQGLPSGIQPVPLQPAAHWRQDRPGLILAADGTPAGTGWKKQRAASLLALFAASRPRLLLLDRFPFGHAAFRFELKPMLEMARRRAQAPRTVALTIGDQAPEPAMRALIDLVVREPALLPQAGV